MARFVGSRDHLVDWGAVKGWEKSGVSENEIKQRIRAMKAGTYGSESEKAAPTTPGNPEELFMMVSRIDDKGRRKEYVSEPPMYPVGEGG